MVLRTGMSPPRAIREEGEEGPLNPVAGRDNLGGHLKLESAYLRQLLICHGNSQEHGLLKFLRVARVEHCSWNLVCKGP